MNESFDIVIVGSGIGGLSTLLYLSTTNLYKQGKLSVCLICKGALNETNTNWAQGGIAAVNALEDNFESHIQDTLIAGALMNKKNIVEKVVNAAPTALNDLINWGTTFDKNKEGAYDLAKEGGHSAARIWHSRDQTGSAIQHALMHAIHSLNNVTIIESACVIGAEKVAQSTFAIKVYHEKDKSFSNINCNKLVLATGGIGRLYDKSTNQQIATGDGIYLACQLGAEIENLSFIQFHPTGLNENGQTAFLISEALRGAGAVLRNEHGAAFMSKYDERLDLAPRDIVSRAIMAEITAQNNPYVYLDATQLDPVIIDAHFPAIQQECKLRLDIDIKKEYIPVLPVQHYSCGGVAVDEYGETSISGLFAIGEVASTGLHGANRLASNSLLEAITFAKFSVPKLLNQLGAFEKRETVLPIPAIKKVNRKLVQQIMSKYAGIVKSNTGLTLALEELTAMKNEALLMNEFSLEDFESNCILQVAIYLIQNALSQVTNKGVYYNTDLI